MFPYLTGETRYELLEIEPHAEAAVFSLPPFLHQQEPRTSNTVAEGHFIWLHTSRKLRRMNYLLKNRRGTDLIPTLNRCRLNDVTVSLLNTEPDLLKTKHPLIMILSSSSWCQLCFKVRTVIVYCHHTIKKKKSLSLYIYIYHTHKISFRKVFIHTNQNKYTPRVVLNIPNT